MVINTTKIAKPTAGKARIKMLIMTTTTPIIITALRYNLLYFLLRIAKLINIHPKRSDITAKNIVAANTEPTGLIITLISIIIPKIIKSTSMIECETTSRSSKLFSNTLFKILKRPNIIKVSDTKISKNAIVAIENIDTKIAKIITIIPEMIFTTL